MPMGFLKGTYLVTKAAHSGTDWLLNDLQSPYVVAPYSRHGRNLGQVVVAIIGNLTALGWTGRGVCRGAVV